ncbi:MAG: efflux RND transporter permease subunit [Gammaproteobacteria bacterium]|nr:efflux RND transporter permease subunit [Gammaproteobacteria bacterium]
MYFCLSVWRALPLGSTYTLHGLKTNLIGPTLNCITLYALILALGMLVDDAIVVIENSYRHYHELSKNADNSAKAAAVTAATHEIGNPNVGGKLTASA